MILVVPNNFPVHQEDHGESKVVCSSVQKHMKAPKSRDIPELWLWLSRCAWFWLRNSHAYPAHSWYRDCQTTQAAHEKNSSLLCKWGRRAFQEIVGCRCSTRVCIGLGFIICSYTQERRVCEMVHWPQSTVKDTFTQPIIEDCLNTLAGTVWFLKLDANSAYRQALVNPEDR